MSLVQRKKNFKYFLLNLMNSQNELEIKEMVLKEVDKSTVSLQNSTPYLQWKKNLENSLENNINYYG
jgi:hypothetical protein